MKRSILFVALLAVAALPACGGDDDDGGGTPDSAGGGGDSAGAGEAPVISSVAWTHVAPCTGGTPSDVDVTITATDADGTPEALTVSGNVSSCGAIDALEDTITCPQAAPYSGTVTVTDADGNADTQTFTINPCEDGTAP